MNFLLFGSVMSNLLGTENKLFSCETFILLLLLPSSIYSLFRPVWPHHSPHSSYITVSDNVSLAFCSMYNGMSVRAPTVLPFVVNENLWCLKMTIENLYCRLTSVLQSSVQTAPMKLSVIQICHKQYVTLACR